MLVFQSVKLALMHFNTFGPSLLVPSVLLQVMSMFAAADIKWPSHVLELLNILSAFNLNIQIVAPECLVPSVSFAQKFAFIVTLPAVLGLFFIIMHVCYVAYKAFVMGRRNNLHRNVAVSSGRAWNNTSCLSYLLVILFGSAYESPKSTACRVWRRLSFFSSTCYTSTLRRLS